MSDDVTVTVGDAVVVADPGPVTAAGLPVGDLAAILAIDDSTEEWVDVPEWKCKVQVKSLSKATQIQVRRQSTSKRGEIDEAKFEGLLFIAGVVQPHFQAEHLPRLMGKSSGPFTKVVNRILVVSGMADDDQDEGTDEDTFQD